MAAVRIVKLIIMVLESGSNLVLNALKLKGWKLEREQKKVTALGVSSNFYQKVQNEILVILFQLSFEFNYISVKTLRSSTSYFR